MYGCYRREEAADATVMLDAAAAVLADYTPDVIRYVTDPRTGLQSRLKWPPVIAEIKEACEKRNSELHVAEQRERAWETSRQHSALPPPARTARLTYRELQDRHGENWGISQSEGHVRVEWAPPTIDQLCAQAGITREEFERQYAEATKRGA